MANLALMLDYLEGKMKTPEEMAEEFAAINGRYDPLNANCRWGKNAFIAGYKAAQEHAHAALEEAEARIQELQEQVADAGKVMFCVYCNDMHGGDCAVGKGKNHPALAKSQWISVKDRLPDKEDEYLAFGYSASNAARWIVVMYDPRDTFWYELSSDWDWTDDITHWMPLPAAPKEEE